MSLHHAYFSRDRCWTVSSSSTTGAIPAARHSERACQTPSLRGSRCADSGTRARISSRSTSWSPQKCSTRLPIAAHVPLTMTADVAGPLTNSMEHLRNIELACAADWQELLEERRSRIQGFGDGRGIELRSELHALQRLPAIADFDEGRCDVVLDTLRNTIQVPTLRLNMMRMVGIFARPNWPPALAALPDEVRRNWQERADQMRHEGPPADDTFAKWSQFLTSKLKARGVPIGAGTDTPISLAIPGYALHTELELLVEGGLTPLEAVHAATVQPARFFGLEDETGQVQAGMRADLLLLEGNPAEDIRNTRRIAGVMTRGEWVP